MKRIFVLFAGLLVSCGGSSPGQVKIPLDDFVLSAPDLAEIQNAQDTGGAAGASYTYDETAGVISLTFTASDLDCEGLPAPGDAITAEVVSLSATAMTLNITVVGETEGDLIDFTRVDSGEEGIVGVWETQDGDETIYLVLTADGAANFITDEACPDEPERNGDGCIVINRTGFSITTDGDDSDWDSVGAGAVIEDATGDQTAGGMGADILRMRATTSGDRLYVLLEFGDTVSVPANTSIRFQTRQSTGSSVQQVGADIGRNGADDGWIVERTSNPSVTANFAVVGSILEIDIPLVEDSVDVLRADLYQCSMTPGAGCEEIEAVDECAGLNP